jgi:hypothetical protein
MTTNHRGHGEKLARKAELAIAALLDRPTVTEAAAAVGVDESTLRSWLKDPTFRTAYRAARADVLERTVARLVAASVKAVDALERNLTAARAADQVRAATAILGHITRGLEVHDLAAQVQELGEQVKADQEAPQHEQQAGLNGRSCRPRHLAAEGDGDGNGDGSDEADQGRQGRDQGGDGGNDPGDLGGDWTDPGPVGADRRGGSGLPPLF